MRDIVVQMDDKSYNDIFHLMIIYFSSLLLIIANNGMVINLANVPNVSVWHVCLSVRDIWNYQKCDFLPLTFPLMPRYYFFNEKVSKNHLILWIIANFSNVSAWHFRKFQKIIKRQQKAWELTRYAFCYQLVCTFEAVKKILDKIKLIQSNIWMSRTDTLYYFDKIPPWAAHRS